MSATNKYKTIEDFLCDWVDSVTQDGVLCSKELDMQTIGSRAAYLSVPIKPIDDHDILWRGHASVQELSPSRSSAIDLIDKIRSALPVSEKKSDIPFAIRLNWGYSTVPYRIMIGSVPAYIVSVDIDVSTT